MQDNSKITPKMLPECSQMAPWTPLRTTSPKCDAKCPFFMVFESHVGAQWAPLGLLKSIKVTKRRSRRPFFSRLNKASEKSRFSDTPEPSRSCWDCSESAVQTVPTKTCLSKEREARFSELSMCSIFEKLIFLTCRKDK